MKRRDQSKSQAEGEQASRNVGKHFNAGLTRRKQNSFERVCEKRNKGSLKTQQRGKTRRDRLMNKNGKDKSEENKQKKPKKRNPGWERMTSTATWDCRGRKGGQPTND